MVEPIYDEVKRSLAAAEGPYHRLALLVGDSDSGKTRSLRRLSADLGGAVKYVQFIPKAFKTKGYDQGAWQAANPWRSGDLAGLH
ncbi:MAG: hypothetical protein LBT62_00320 [Deltaproteobacteria bacterium]|nr:hypothetical protein [Deltaproteobacteria bacterium]